MFADLDANRTTLRVAIDGGRYIVKPQAGTFEELPETEWVAQRLAARASIDVPVAGLIDLADGSRA